MCVRVKMVKFLSLAKTIEEQCVKRFTQRFDGGLVAQILMPRVEASVVNVAVCQDGRGREVSFDMNLQKHLQTLYAYWGYAVEVRVYPFSFVADVHLMMDVLLDADIFYMAGVFEVPKLWIYMTKPGGCSHCLVETLQARVQYNSLAFIGVCGGAVISGASNHYGLQPLDLLQGTTIRYDSNCNAKSVNVMTTTQEFQLTTGCAFAIYLWQDTRKSVSFLVVKNAGQWWPFAEHNSIALEEALVQKVALPLAYRNPVSKEYCFFWRDGYIYDRSCLCKIDPFTLTLDRLTLKFLLRKLSEMLLRAQLYSLYFPD